MRDLHPLAGPDVVVAAGSAIGLAAPVRMHVAEHGRRGGAVVLMLHGLPATSYLWRDVARDLEQDHLCLMPDLLGLGASERPAQRRAYALDVQARVLAGLLDELRIDRVIVAGHDLGGAVAVHLVSLFPHRVAGLVLIDAPVHADAWPARCVQPLLIPGLGELEAWSLRRFPRLARRVMKRSPGWSLPERELDTYLRPLLDPSGAAAMLRFIRAVDLTAVEAAWRLVCAAPPPALVLWGECDRILRASYGRRIAGEISAGWVPIGDADHLLPQHRPERVAEEIEAFAAELL